jgi:predicted SprT family Zn-dependent metalloprotease
VTLPLTPEILAATYGFLRVTPPFNRWKLPPAGDVKFRVMRTKQFMGQHFLEPEGHVIDVSAQKVGYTRALILTIAHEMVHMAQHERGLPRTHNADFERMTAQVCKFHGFDPKEF